MPKIPTYDSRATLRAETLRTGKLTTEAPAIRIPAESFSAPFQALGKLGEAVGKIGENIYALQAQEELSKANIAAHQGRLQIENTEDAETQGWLDRRNKEIQDLRQNTLKGMRNPLAKKEFEAEFDNDIIDTQFRLKRAYTGLTVSKVKLALYQERETAEQEIFAGINDQRKQARIDKIGKRYAQLARLGGMKPDEALKEFRGWQVGLSKNQVKYEIEINPQFALDKLSRGLYPNISKLETVEFMEDAQQKIDKQIGEISRQQLITYATNMDIVRDNDISGQPMTVEEIKNLRDQNRIPSSFALSKIKSLTSAKAINVTTDIRTFEEIFGNIIRRDISATEIREKIYNENAKGKLSNSDIKRLLFAEKGEGITTVYEDFIQEQEELKKTKKETQPRRNFWGIVKDIAMVASPITAPFVINNTIDRALKENILDERIIEIAKDETRKQILKDKPEIAKLPKEGYLHYDKFGNKATIYPDGTYEEVIRGEFKHKEQRKRKEPEEK